MSCLVSLDFFCAAASEVIHGDANAAGATRTINEINRVRRFKKFLRRTVSATSAVRDVIPIGRDIAMSFRAAQTARNPPATTTRVLRRASPAQDDNVDAASRLSAYCR